MALIFEVTADMAVFRKPYTTTSIVSFPFPPPTAVAGLIGAIIGIDHKAEAEAKNAFFWRKMKGIQISIALINPIRWAFTAVNLMKYISTNADMSEHIRVKQQILKKPGYRIYIRGGEVYHELKKCLEKNEFIFTPYLGVAYALADIKFIGEEKNDRNLDDDQIVVNTIVPLYDGVEFDVSKPVGLHKEIVPFKLDERRKILETVPVIYPEYSINKERYQIHIKNKGRLEVSKIGDDKVAWFHAW